MVPVKLKCNFPILEYTLLSFSLVLLWSNFLGEIRPTLDLDDYDNYYVDRTRTRTNSLLIERQC